jgi:5S rRNA maturation endonuclease (ribonuclease M5)
MNKLTTYRYHNEQNELLFSKVRTENNGTKSFYFERKENDATVRNLKETRRVLYRLPHVLKAIDQGFPIFLVEGEKDADTLMKYAIENNFNYKLMATTAPTTLEWHEEFNAALKDADIIILYDNDKAGLKRRDLLCNNLYGRVKRLRVIDLPGIEYSESHGKDITDWFAMSNTIEGLKKLVEEAPDYKPPHQTTKHLLRTVSTEELFALEIPEREMLLAPFLPTQGLVLLVAKRGVGKTHIALGIAYAVATGGTFLQWAAPTKKRVLYIDGEMPAVLMQERLRMISTMTKKHPADYLQLITPDLQDRVMPDLAHKEGRDMLESLINNIDLIVIDNISCLFRSGSENESESWQEAQEWALDLRRRGKSVLFVHHAGKSGHQRGTSKREDTLDSVIILKHPDDYKSEEGARFDVIFDKARHFSGEDAKSFQAQLITRNDISYWEVSDAPQEAEIARIAEMKKAGLTIKQIMQEMDLTKAQVEWRTSKAREEGLL